jgi:chromosomal replication initiation ATPase DnaA
MFMALGVISSIASLSTWSIEKLTAESKSSLWPTADENPDTGKTGSPNKKLRKFEMEDVIGAGCSYFKVPADRLAGGGKDLRDVAIYILKRHTSVKNREIGELFEGLTYSGVSRANQRFSVDMAGDRILRKAVEKIAGSMSNVKVTPLPRSVKRW